MTALSIVTARVTSAAREILPLQAAETFVFFAKLARLSFCLN
jgi:hypothetical protein